MSSKTASSIIGPPANSLAETLESVVDDELQVIAEYDCREYELLYVTDWVLDEHGGRVGVEAEAEAVFNYFHLDFLERELLADLLWLGDVGTFVTYLDHGVVVRVNLENAGVFVALDVTASVDDVQVIIENTLFEEGDDSPGSTSVGVGDHC